MEADEKKHAFSIVIAIVFNIFWFAVPPVFSQEVTLPFVGHPEYFTTLNDLLVAIPVELAAKRQADGRWKMAKRKSDESIADSIFDLPLYVFETNNCGLRLSGFQISDDFRRMLLKLDDNEIHKFNPKTLALITNSLSIAIITGGKVEFIELRNRLVSRLLELQRKGGDWGDSETPNEADIVTTAFVVECFCFYSDISIEVQPTEIQKAIEKTKKFVSQYKATGGAEAAAWSYCSIAMGEDIELGKLIQNNGDSNAGTQFYFSSLAMTLASNRVEGYESWHQQLVKDFCKSGGSITIPDSNLISEERIMFYLGTRVPKRCEFYSSHRTKDFELE